MPPPTKEQMERAVRAAIDEIDPIQMAAFRRMTPQEKMRRVADMFATGKHIAIASERHFHPDLPEAEIYRRAMKRWMRASEWEPELRKMVFGE